MSNRFLAILIIIWFIGLSYLFVIKMDNSNENNKNQEIVKTLENKKKITNLAEQNVVKTILTNTQKIENIKQNKWNYKTFMLNNWEKVYFKLLNDSLDLYLENVKIWNFSLVYPEFLRVETIEWTEKGLYIEVWNEKFIFDNIESVLSKINLNINVKYVKIWINEKYIFVTEKWSFILKKYENKIEYFNYFNDFVYFNDWYIWIVKKEEKRILNNLWFNKYNKNLIVYYNPNTKEKRIVYKTNLDIKKIYTFNNDIYIKGVDNELFKLENFE